MNILVAEDSSKIKKMLVDALCEKYPKCRITEVIDGKAAFHSLTQNSFDLIIVDVDMGGSNGITFVRKLLGNKILNKKKIVIHSNHSDFLINSEILQSKNVCFIDKYSPKNSLINKIDEFYNS